MSIIYEPKGKAREYSPLAVNLYNGCNHGCTYCYCPSIRKTTRENYLNVQPRRNIIQELEKDCIKYCYSKKQVFICFMTDPYNSADKELKITRAAIKLFLKYKIPICILTKAGKECLRDIDLFKKFKNNIMVGATLTFIDPKKSEKTEPYAATPKERIETLEYLKKEGIKTWASLEPVIDIQESLMLIEKTIDLVDVYKLGKLNHDKKSKDMDWHKFLTSAISMLRKNNKDFYVKHDLRQACPGIKLYGNEILMDEFCTAPFPQQNND